MSYNIGQLRRNQITTYETKIPIFGKQYQKNLKNKYMGTSIQITNSGFKLEKGILKKDVSYYFSFTTSGGTSSEKIFRVKLLGDGKEMVVKEILLPRPNTVYELIFTPNDDIYDYIVMERILTSDISASALNNPILLKENSHYPSYKDGEESTYTTLKELVNIIPSYLQGQYDNLQYLKKMGLQGPPGLLFAMNGEEIRIGKSGIYEVDNLAIENLGFVIKNTSPIPYEDAKDFFIMDFQY